MNDITAIFAFLKYCLGYKGNMSKIVARMDWQGLYSFASKQALLGLCFEGIERLGKEYPEEMKQNPIGRELLMNWMGKAQQIRRQNMKVNAVAGKLFAMLREDGMRCCVLKGQGNAFMYPNPYSRTSGDIDVWIDASRERIMEYAQKRFELGDDIRLQHLEPSLDGVPVELHFFDEGIGMRQIIDYFLVVNDFSKNVFLDTDLSNCSVNFSNLPVNFSNHPVPLSKEGSTFSPSPSQWSLYPLRFPRLRGTETSGSGDVTAPSRCSEPLRSKVGGPSKVSPDCAGWDRLSIEGDNSAGSIDTSATVARSSFAAGSSSASSITSVSSASTADSSASTALDVVQRELKHLGLWKFAGAVMYVLHEVLGLSEDKIIVPVDEKRGRLLLAEILDGGNFGRHFTKYGGFTHQSMGKKYFLKIWRSMHFVRYYPAEALCEPLFRTWHFFWRMKNKK